MVTSTKFPQDDQSDLEWDNFCSWKQFQNFAFFNGYRRFCFLRFRYFE